MRYKWKWEFITVAIGCYEARVVIYDDIGMLRRVPPVPGVISKNNGPTPTTGAPVRYKQPKNMRASPLSPGSNKIPIKIQLPGGFIPQPLNNSTPKNLMGATLAKAQSASKSPYNRPDPPQLIRRRLMMPGNRANQSPIPRTPNNLDDIPNKLNNGDYDQPDPIPPAEYAPVSSSRSKSKLPKTFSLNTSLTSSSEEKYNTTVTVVSYVSNNLSSTIRKPERTSIKLDSSALSSVNTAIPGMSDPLSSSVMDGIPDRADIDDKKLNEYMNDHDSNIGQANTARKSFLSMKIQEVENTIKRNEAKIANLQRIYDEYSKRMDQLSNEIARAKSDMGMYKALVTNNDAEIERLDGELRENETDRRLEDAELLRLNKELNEVKNEIELLKEKTTLMRSRLKQMNTSRTDSVSKLQSNENKLGIYVQLAEELRSELKELKENISEVEAVRRKEQDTLNKLEIEYNQYENDRHLPLFVRYT